MPVLEVQAEQLSKLSTRFLFWAAFLVLLIKISFFLLDPYPAFHFGDSGAYLATALAKWIPPDRSFTYGFLLRPLVLTTHSLLPVLLLQLAISAVASILAGFLLCRYFAANFGLALTLSFLCAIEPLQLMSERFVMTETAATFAFSLFIWACLEFLASNRLWVLIATQVLGVAIISLRYSFIPLVVLTSLLLPVLSCEWHGRRGTAWKPALSKLLICFLVSQFLLAGYRQLYGHLGQCKPAYLSRDGDFLISDVVPLVQPQDFPIARERARLFQNITIPRSGIDTRRLHRWLPGGICAAILQVAGGDEELANQLAKEMALHAMRRDPAGFLQLGARTFLEFFNLSKLEWALHLDQGDFVPPTDKDALAIKRWFEVDATDRKFDSLTKRWEGMSAPWCWLIVILPVIYAVEIAVHRSRASRLDVFLLLAAWALLLAAIFPVEIANPRYLTPLPWLSILIIGVMMSRLRSNTGSQQVGFVQWVRKS